MLMLPQPSRLHLAAGVGDMKSLKALWGDGHSSNGGEEDKGPEDINALDEYGVRPALSYACQGAHLDAIRFLLDHCADIDRRDGTPHGRTSLMWACLFGRVEVVRLLLARGANPLIRDANGLIAFNYAAGSPPDEMDEHEGYVSMLRLLLPESKAMVDVRGVGGKTALFAACSFGVAKAVRLLLVEGGADHRIVDEDGATPLQVAEDGGRRECVEVIKWFESELERCYCLRRARQIEDDREAISQAARKARTAEEGQRAREEAAPEHLRGRVMRGEALPVVTVGAAEKGNGGCDGDTAVIEAVLEQVLLRMRDDPFTMVVEMMVVR